MSIEGTLSERSNRYGDFTSHADIAQQLQDVMRRQEGWNHLDAVKKQALTFISDKIARILNGDPEYADNWHDIQGYARLVEERLPQLEMDFVGATLPKAVFTTFDERATACIGSTAGKEFAR